MVCLTKIGVEDSENFPFGPLVWRSHRLRRVVVSTISGETLALTDSLGPLERLLCLALEIYYPDFRLADREQFFGRYKSAHVIDAKSFYHHVRSHNPSQGCEDKRTGLDFIVGRETLSRLQCTLRWGPGSVQLAYVLTKDDAEPADPWRGYLRHQRYRLGRKSESLQIRAQEKELRKERGRLRQEEAVRKQETERVSTTKSHPEQSNASCAEQ